MRVGKVKSISNDILINHIEIPTDGKTIVMFHLLGESGEILGVKKQDGTVKVIELT